MRSDDLDIPRNRVRPLFQTRVGGHQERSVRLPFRMPVRFREKRRLAVDAQGVVVNVSLTGLYIAVRHPPGINDIVTLTLPGAGIDGGEKSLRIRAQVRWWRHSRTRPDEPLGFGVKILDFPDAEQRERYRAFVQRLLAAREESALPVSPDERAAPRDG